MAQTVHDFVHLMVEEYSAVATLPEYLVKGMVPGLRFLGALGEA